VKLVGDRSSPERGLILAWRFELPVILLVAALLYSPSLGSGFVYDDHWTVVHNPFLLDVHNAAQLFDGRAYRAGVPDAWRPTMVLSQMADVHLFDHRPAGHHLHSLLWHLVAVLLVAVLALRLSSSPPMASVAALLFAVHPIHVEAVAAINYREDLLATCFCLAALILSLKPTTDEKHPWRSIASAGLLLLGLLAKETAAVAPLLLLAVRRAQGASWRAALRSAVPLGAALAVFALFRLASLGSLNPYPGAGVAPPPTSAWTHAASSLVALAATIGRILLPAGFSAEYPARPTTVAPIAASAGVVLALVYVGWRWSRPARAADQRLATPGPSTLVGLGIVFFLVGWLPTSGLVPMPNREADRFAYLPSVGFCIALAPLFLGQFVRVWRLLGLAVLLICYAASAVLAQRMWRNDLTLWSAALRRAPSSARAWSGLASALRRSGQLPPALEAAERAVELGPSSAEAHLILANALTEARRYAEAEEHFAKAAAASPQQPAHLYAGWGLSVFRRGDHARAAELLLRATTLPPPFAGAWANLAEVEVARGHCEDAARAAAEAGRLDPPGRSRHLLLLRPCEHGMAGSVPPAKSPAR
jgi:protein O-mannosyl-transferase